MLLGFGHRKRSGKTTCAEFLRDRYNFEVFAFADPLKISLVSLFHFSHDQVYGESKELTDLRWGITPRQAMQRFNDHMRKAFGEDIWVKMMQRRLESHYEANPLARIAISDVRHQPEIDLIKRLGGSVVHINRPSLGPPDDPHLSEDSVSESCFDYTIINNNSLRDLYEQLLRLPPVNSII